MATVKGPCVRGWCALSLGLAVLLLCAQAGAAESLWDPRQVRALIRLEQLGSGSCRARWRQADGTIANGWVRWGDLLSSATQQTRLDEWLATAPDRHLPRVGEVVRVLNRFDTGKPLEGSFLGFDGPILVVGQGRKRPELHLEWTDLQVVDGAGRPLAGLGGSPEDWPPARRPLLLWGPNGQQALWPHQVNGLELSEWSAGDTAFVAVLAILAVGVYGMARALGEAMGMAVMPSD